MTTWREITPADENGRRMLVTNNLNARDAHGLMSHVWIGFVLASTEGGYVTFDQGGRKIESLTHCCPVPMPASPDKCAICGSDCSTMFVTTGVRDEHVCSNDCFALWKRRKAVLGASKSQGCTCRMCPYCQGRQWGEP